jgi:hypothetical protein
MEHVKHFDPVADDPIEDQIVTVYPPAYPQMFISRNQYVASWGVDQRLATPPNFPQERQRPCRILSGDPVTD